MAPRSRACENARKSMQGGSGPMPLLGKKTPEELAAKEASKAAAEEEKTLERYMKSPPGRARAAFENTDKVFQYEYDLLNLTGKVVSFGGRVHKRRTDDPSDVL